MNLIICCTPLQVLIAEKIIEQYPNEHFLGLMLAPLMNDKHQYYYERLAKICSQSNIIIEKSSRYVVLMKMIKVRFMFFDKKIDRIFVANIDNKFVQIIISRFLSSKLYTFDDGTVNIIKKNFHYFKAKNKFFVNFIIRLLTGNNQDIESIKKKSILHYTIYPNIPNIVENTISVDIFDKFHNSFVGEEIIENASVVKIMLGQPLFPNNFNKYKIITEEIIKNYSIDYYFPHPRESGFLDNIKYIDTHLIFEDYFIKNFSDKKCIVYTYFSSLALNLVGMSNVKFIAFRLKDFDAEIKELYDIFEMMGIDVINY